MKKCTIVGAGSFAGFCPEFTSEYIIAVDGGYDNLKRFNLSPNLLIGDFDSIESTPDNIETIRFSSIKDESDLELAVAEAIRRGYVCFYIYGALGGRLDHTLASIAVLASASMQGFTGYLVGENERITAITNKKIAFSKSESGNISVFPVGKEAAGVSIGGLKYPLDNAVLSCDSTLGLSNEFIGEDADIEVKDGTLVVVHTVTRAESVL